MAQVAFFEKMVGNKLFPVLHLARRKRTGALAQRADILHGRKNRLADKLRAIGQFFQLIEQFPVNLESDYLLLVFFHFIVTPGEIYYLPVKLLLGITFLSRDCEFRGYCDILETEHLC